MKIDFTRNAGLVPAIVQDARTEKVLMLAYMNAESIAQTKSTGKVTFFSRSKQRLWTKGETSGNFLEFKEMFLDCDGDTLLIKAIPAGPACHTGADTCFNETNKAPQAEFLLQLQDIIRSRKISPVPDSYTAKLFSKGLKKIAQKVGEEGVEVALEGVTQDKEKLKEESADLLYHLLVLLVSSDVSLESVLEVLKARNQNR